jgi:hypothetical protein
MISKELADPSDLFFKYLKSLFSIALSHLFYNTTTNPKTKEAPFQGPLKWVD